jgi:hypothetical protein
MAAPTAKANARIRTDIPTGTTYLFIGFALVGRAQYAASNSCLRCPKKGPARVMAPRGTREPLPSLGLEGSEARYGE